MPFKSEKQRKYLYANEPEVAESWAKKEKRKKKKKHSQAEKNRAVERITQ